MPKAPPPTTPDDRRTRVDRVLDRIKDNPVAAVVIVLALAVGGIASLTDSARKLADLAGSFGGADLAGEWKTEVATLGPRGDEFMRLTLAEPASGQVVGEVQFSGNGQAPPRSTPLLSGKRDGKAVTLLFDSGGGHATVVGDLAGDRLRLVLQPPGQGAVALTARRIPQRTQLLAGRPALVYRGQVFDDPRAACTQMLKDLDPPQSYRLSEPPDAHGNVRCAGRLPGGEGGFDQFQNEVQQALVCPPRSRPARVGGTVPPAAQGCECDGAQPASGGACAPA